jgi:hypothetical protein
MCRSPARSLNASLPGVVSDAVSTKPRPEDYPTAWSYWQARRSWVRSHGGDVVGVLAIAVLFGALSGSAIAFVVLVVFAVGAAAFARSRP